ncbi:Hsp20/alpha crystallin family protein [Pseudoxanthomonas sacheonensis]|uniref:HSP20 family protein n=1 Tax=Pseudoxanthomonas sacheonensis TaxID=443615 RepID=A0ABU1RQ28_9GAMM|nr:Hsp20/alpha crystallin family protein [Pseudoxanthomonas sacheonensis]MDR6840881.1 HSP20 family protein [Pseudoxanthomonas sacheonensis]
MHAVRYRHWPRQVARQQQINQLFEHFFDKAAANAPAEAQWVPRVDVREEAERFVILADLPGISADAIEIQMDKGVLSIKGERANPALGEGEKYSRTERRQGAFHREFALPDSADAEGIVAKGGNGVLEISIPKKAQPAPRRIQVGEPTVQ